MTGWADPDRWAYRRRVESTYVDRMMSPLELATPNYHFTELDGVTPLSVASYEEVGDDGIVLWINQRGESKKGFYIYYEPSVQEAED